MYRQNLSTFVWEKVLVKGVNLRVAEGKDGAKWGEGKDLQSKVG